MSEAFKQTFCNEYCPKRGTEECWCTINWDQYESVRELVRYFIRYGTEPRTGTDTAMMTGILKEIMEQIEDGTFFN